MNKKSLIGYTLAELQAFVREEGLPERIGSELARWIYKRKAGSFMEMDTFSMTIRNRLAAIASTGHRPPVQTARSADGSIKYLFPAGKGRFVEAVFIPHGKRRTLCLSSQAGCRMGCMFCETGKQGFGGNLSAGEMINQVLSLPEEDRPNRLVFMGMGEPLDNLSNLLPALEIITSQYGLAFSPRQVTVSTVGLLPQTKIFLEKSRCNLAFSLHSPFEEERMKFIPAEKNHPFRKILRTIEKCPPETKRRLSVAYVMIQGINDSAGHLEALTALLKGTPLRVNLIPYHPIPSLSLKPSSVEIINHFFRSLNEKGIPATIRRSRGQDIEAACGLLTGKHRGLF